MAKSEMHKKWPNVLLLCEFVFSLPFTTSRVEQIFSMLKTIKTKRRASLHTSTLGDLLEINLEGPPLSDFSPDGKSNPRKEYQLQTVEDLVEGDEGPEQNLALEDWDVWMAENELA